jgi:hypothetical protein
MITENKSRSIKGLLSDRGFIDSEVIAKSKIRHYLKQIGTKKDRIEELVDTYYLFIEDSHFTVSDIANLIDSDRADR